MKFIFGLFAVAQGRTGILVVVDRFSKMVHLAPDAASNTAEDTAKLFIDIVSRHHGLPETIVSDRDFRFTAGFWSQLYTLLGTRLLLPTAAYLETCGQTESANCVLEDFLRSYAASFTSWSAFLPITEFAMNNAVHASTCLTTIFVNNARYPRPPVLLGLPDISTLGGGGTPDELAWSDSAPATMSPPCDKVTL
uniref:Integrase catalytic domain-containing protein n=1 Tax=Peronospora matthiolae TaxID=2874970 RepID=A0AAV1TV82_9STRA